MEMTIENCIEYMETEYSCVKSDDMTSKEDIKAYEMTLSIMRKYQKIEQILDDCDLEAWEVLGKIKKVVEDGKID